MCVCSCYCTSNRCTASSCSWSVCTRACREHTETHSDSWHCDHSPWGKIDNTQLTYCQPSILAEAQWLITALVLEEIPAPDGTALMNTSTFILGYANVCLSVSGWRYKHQTTNKLQRFPRKLSQFSSFMIISNPEWSNPVGILRIFTYSLE